MKLNQLMLEADILDLAAFSVSTICSQNLAAFSVGTTYSQLCGKFALNEQHRMQIDRTLQKLRRSGKIKWERRGPSIVWVRV